MASYVVKDDNHPYYTVKISFNNLSFIQDVIIPNKDTLAASLQAYADDYEYDWTQQQNVETLP